MQAFSGMWRELESVKLFWNKEDVTFSVQEVCNAVGSRDVES